LRQRVKAELRKRMRGLRNTMPASACAERSSAIIARLAELDAVRVARTIALFWPIEARHEVDLRPLDASLRARGAKVAYPAIDPDTRVMSFRFVEDPALLEERGFGFREPPSGARDAERGDLDVLVVPALAFDPRGHRIGYGAGYYDRTVPRFAPPATTVIVGYDYQLLPETPSTAVDVPLEWIVTDRRTLKASPPETPAPSAQ
jgi:5-formyltetrahydrofolate cyclo-ligase